MVSPWERPIRHVSNKKSVTSEISRWHFSRWKRLGFAAGWGAGRPVCPSADEMREGSRFKVSRRSGGTKECSTMVTTQINQNWPSSLNIIPRSYLLNNQAKTCFFFSSKTISTQIEKMFWLDFLKDRLTNLEQTIISVSNLSLLIFITNAAAPLWGPEPHKKWCIQIVFFMAHVWPFARLIG